jgi:Zn-dependent peptidase ImmA (M78 family)/DNA-binding XRE family transcriptional regulator
VSAGAVFDPRRLTLARWVAELSKKELAERVGVSPASITQYEAGKTVPPATTESRLALACGVSPSYLRRTGGRRRPDFSTRSFFRSLRSTPQRERDRADGLAEHVLDLAEVIEREVYLPDVSIPLLSPARGDRGEIETIAAEVRRQWDVPQGPISHVVRLLEARGVVVARLMSHGRKLDAFSRWFGDRPLVVLWADKSDMARSRFDAAHELGHLVMHTDAEPLSLEQERQANMFASAFTMPADDVRAHLIRNAPTLGDWEEVLRRRAHWGVSAKALLYRSREMGALSEHGFRRAMQNYNRHGLRDRDGSQLGEPERPILLGQAARTAELTIDELAARSSLSSAFVAEVLG